MYLISLLGAQEVFGHVLRQHVSDQCFVPPSHLQHPLLLVMHTDLPEEQLPGLKLQLHTATQKCDLCFAESPEEASLWRC